MAAAGTQTKQAEAEAAATKKAVQLKAAGKQLDKLKKDIAKSSEQRISPASPVSPTQRLREVEPLATYAKATTSALQADTLKKWIRSKLMNLLNVRRPRAVPCGADAEQQKLQGEIDAAMASLDALTVQAGDVVQQQEQLAELQQQQQLLLQEALSKKAEKEQEVLSKSMHGCSLGQSIDGLMTSPLGHSPRG